MTALYGVVLMSILCRGSKATSVLDCASTTPLRRFVRRARTGFFEIMGLLARNLRLGCGERVRVDVKRRRQLCGDVARERLNGDGRRCSSQQAAVVARLFRSRRLRAAMQIYLV